MKKNKLALLASMGLASLVFLSGCVSVDRKTGNPTGLIWNLLGRPMGEAIKFFANNLGLGFGIGIIIVTLIVRLIILRRYWMLALVDSNAILLSSLLCSSTHQRGSR